MTNQVISHWGIRTSKPTVRWVNESHLARLLLNIQTQIPPLCPQSRHGPRWRPSATGFWVPKEKGKLTKYVCLNIYRRSTSATMMSHSWFCFTIVAQKMSVWADWTNSTHLEMHSTKSHPISSANINCNLYFCCNFSNKSPVFGNIFALTVLCCFYNFHPKLRWIGLASPRDQICIDNNSKAGTESLFRILKASCTGVHLIKDWQKLLSCFSLPSNPKPSQNMKLSLPLDH